MLDIRRPPSSGCRLRFRVSLNYGRQLSWPLWAPAEQCGRARLVGKLNFRFATPATYIITPKRGTADRTAQLVYNINCATFVAQPQFGATSTQGTTKKTRTNELDKKHMASRGWNAHFRKAVKSGDSHKRGHAHDPVTPWITRDNRANDKNLNNLWQLTPPRIHTAQPDFIQFRF